MSSDPKKPGLDAPPSGTPEALQKDLSLDRRRRVPSFEELQGRPAPELRTDPMQPAIPRPQAIPQTTVPMHPSTLDDALKKSLKGEVPPGLQARQPPPPAARAAPPSPVQYAQARPQPAAMPQVTPSVPSQGALVPDGQSTPVNRASQVALKPVPARPVVEDDLPEPLTLPAGTAPPRSFTPSPQVLRKPAGLPPEMLVTQPGVPGPFARPQAPAPSPSAPVFEAPRFEEASQGGDTVTAEPAALPRRVGAWLTDLLIVGGLVMIFLTIAMTVIAPKNLSAMQQLMAVAVPGAALAGVLAFVYTTLFAFLWNGRTPGRRLMGIHLVDSTGHAPAPARALVRAMLSLLSFALFLSGFWLALFDRHGQTLHDKLTKTFVVKLQDA